MSSRPFPLNDVWIEASPFKSREKVIDTEKRYKRGEKIGFTALASLRSMGRLPRTDGTYKIGDKYKALK